MKNFEKLPMLALFGLTLCAGCTSPAAQNETAQSDPASVPTVAPAVDAEPTAEAKPTVIAMAPTAPAAPAKPAAAKSPYKVTNPDELAGMGAPPEMVAALKKTKVPPPPMIAVPATVRVQLKTSKGPITVELNGKAAPLHVRSFLYLANRNFYNGTVFHRHADLSGDGKGYIIQGGDPNSKDAKNEQLFGQGGPGYEVPLEANNGLKHEKLVIAAARSNDPNSAGSQFYITQGAVPFLDTQYTVFGKVVEGKDAALKLTQGDKLISTKVLKAKK